MPPDLQSPEIQAFATGFPVTLMHIGVTMLILVLAAGVYILLTPHKEITLIRAGNSAAAVSLGGVLLGLSIPLATSLARSTSMLEVALWGAGGAAPAVLGFSLVGRP